MTEPRAIVIVCDSLGVGELPDAADFGDVGSNTLGHVLDAHHPQLPTLTRLGLLHTLPTPATTDIPSAAYGRMAEISAGKDTTTGHWEMMGLVVVDPFRTYPQRVSSRDHRGVREAHRAQNAREQAGVGDGDPRRAGRGAHAHRFADRVHVGGFGVPGRGA
jgi:phosphopentomutase